MEQRSSYFLTSSNMGLIKVSPAQPSETPMSNGAFMLLETDVLFFAIDFMGVGYIVIVQKQRDVTAIWHSFL